MALAFEWDPAKAAANLKRHGISFEYALAVFGDPLARIFDDRAHSQGEQRELIIGHVGDHVLLVVSFAERPNAIRLMSARLATKRERHEYEENVLP